MALILLSDYAQIHNKAKATVLQMANRGSFQTAKKIGRQWFIDSDEEYPDLRIKSGQYIDWRTKSRSRTNKKKADI